MESPPLKSEHNQEPLEIQCKSIGLKSACGTQEEVIYYYHIMLQKGQKSLGNSSRNKGAGKWHLPPPSPQHKYMATCRTHYPTCYHHHPAAPCPACASTDPFLWITPQSRHCKAPLQRSWGSAQSLLAPLPCYACRDSPPHTHTHNEDHLRSGAAGSLPQRTRNAQSLLTPLYCPHPLLCFCGDRGLLQS